MVLVAVLVLVLDLVLDLVLVRLVLVRLVSFSWVLVLDLLGSRPLLLIMVRFPPILFYFSVLDGGFVCLFFSLLRLMVVVVVAEGSLVVVACGRILRSCPLTRSTMEELFVRAQLGRVGRRMV